MRIWSTSCSRTARVVLKTRLLIGRCTWGNERPFTGFAWGIFYCSQLVHHEIYLSKSVTPENATFPSETSFLPR